MTRASPSVGHGTNLPEAPVFLRAMALELAMQDRVKDLREKHKRVRAAIEGSGVNLDDLKTLYALRDKTPVEVESWLRRKFGAVSAYFRGLKDKFGDDPFSGYGKESDPHRDGWIHRGRMAGVHGEEATPPPGADADEIQWFMFGFHEGHSAWADAQPVLVSILEGDEDEDEDDETPREGGASGEVVSGEASAAPAGPLQDTAAEERLAAAGLDD